MGSSPRVRGTLDCPLTMPSTGGIIPACAGNTRRSPRRTRPSRDHPRVCGEHGDRTKALRSPSGSSPRVRGTPAGDGELARDRGIIPACAGNTSNAGFKRMLARDHPRVCGEHVCKTAEGNAGKGSSPRVRGTPMPRPVGSYVPGIIPACAGNTRFPQCGGACLGDHPRVCGEHRT